MIQAIDGALGSNFVLGESALAPANFIQTLNASFNSQDMKYSKPNGYGVALYYCLVDGTQMKPSDYLVGQDGSTFFIAGMQPLLPILAVECNRVINIFRPQQDAAIGVASYGGNTTANQVQLVRDYPGSILQGGNGDKSIVGLPGDTRASWWKILLPNLPQGVYLRNADIITDDQGRRYAISSAEQTDLGWRIAASESGT